MWGSAFGSLGTSMRLRAGLATICATSAITVWGGEVPAAEAESVGMSTEGLQRIDVAMQRHIAPGGIQGAVTAVARRGRVVHFQAHGLIEVETQRAMPRDAIFMMASSTDPVLGVAAMILIDEGLIRPSDPVEKYIPEFRNMQVAVLADSADKDKVPLKVNRPNPPAHRLVPAQTPITIEHLLTHTSGLVSGGLGTRLAPDLDRTTLAGYVPALGDFALDFQPGTHWSYGGGLQVVARIIEIVSGMPYGEFMQTRVFDPLEMNDTHFKVPPSKMPRRVVIPGFDMSNWDGETTSRSLWSTARDYLHFQQMLANGGELFGRRLLARRSPSTLRSRWTDTAKRRKALPHHEVADGLRDAAASDGGWIGTRLAFRAPRVDGDTARRNARRDVKRSRTSYGRRFSLDGQPSLLH